MAAPITKYATRTDMALYALPAAVLLGIEGDTIDAALESASRKADSYLQAQYTLPLTSVSKDLTEAVTWLAAYTLMASVGYAPDAGQDLLISSRYKNAIDYLTGVREGKLSPPDMSGSETDNPSTGQAVGARPFGISSSSRGYSSRGDGIPRVVFDLRGPRGGFVGD